jgi:hypothetical protein
MHGQQLVPHSERPDNPRKIFSLVITQSSEIKGAGAKRFECRLSCFWARY